MLSSRPAGDIQAKKLQARQRKITVCVAQRSLFNAAAFPLDQNKARSLKEERRATCSASRTFEEKT